MGQGFEFTIGKGRKRVHDIQWLLRPLAEFQKTVKQRINPFLNDRLQLADRLRREKGIQRRAPKFVVIMVHSCQRALFSSC